MTTTGMAVPKVPVGHVSARDACYPHARTMQSDVPAVCAGSPPPHATRLTSARAEATRAERPAPPAALAQQPPLQINRSLAQVFTPLSHLVIVQIAPGVH
jgi:hypothetical protein